MEVLNVIFRYFEGVSLTYAVSIRLKLVRIPPLRRYLEFFNKKTWPESFIPYDEKNPQRNLPGHFSHHFRPPNTQPHQLSNLGKSGGLCNLRVLDAFTQLRTFRPFCARLGLHQLGRFYVLAAYGTAGSDDERIGSSMLLGQPMVRGGEKSQ